MIRDSELIINRDGTIFHLHLRPENIASKIILVGDPGRVDLVASNFDSSEFRISNREFVSVTGSFNNTRVTVVSTGIGTDNIDIVLNELDALVNVDFKSRAVKDKITHLDILRIGTSGALQPDIPVNSFVVSAKSIGFDDVLSYYANWEQVCDTDFEERLKESLGGVKSLSHIYVVNASEELLRKFNSPDFIRGVNISAPGFYGPQGRVIRLPLADPELNERIESFRYQDYSISNYEMESSAIYGLCRLMGHRALTVCEIIANRVTGDANENYHQNIAKLIRLALQKFTG